MPEDRGFFESLLVASPFVAGSAFALQQAARAGAFKLPAQSFLSQTIGAAPRVPMGETAKEMLKYLSGEATYFRTTEGAEVARRAWMEAIQSTDPLAGEILTFAGDIRNAPVNRVYTSIEQTLRANNSLFMASTYSKFKQNIGLLKRQMEIGGMPEFQRVEGLAFPPAMNVPVNELPAELQAFRKKFLKETGVTGTGVQYFTRKGWQQEGFGTYMMGFRYQGRPFDITIPMSQRGVLVEGLTQSSRRIAPGAAIFDPRLNPLETLTRHEYYLRNIERLAPRIAAGEYKSAFDIQRELGGIYERNIYALENIPNLPLGMRNVAWENYQRVRGQAMDIRILEGDIYRPPTNKEMARIMERGGLYPATSPSNIAEGRLTTFDPRGWSMTPEDVAFARRPTQALREWRMTPAAVEEFMNQGSKWSIFETQAWRRDFGNYAAPHIRTLYVDPAMHGAALERLGMGEGEAIITGTPAARRMLETFRAADPIHLRTVQKGLAERIAAGGTFEVGEVLGWTPEGRAATYEPGMRLLGLEPFETTGKGEFMSLFYAQTHRPGIAAKRFGAFKAMEKFVDPLQMERAVLEMTKGMSPEQRAVFANFPDDIWRIVSADELRKDMSKRNTQIITGLWDMIDRTRSRDFIQRNAKLASFMRNPRIFAAHIGKTFGVGEEFARGMRQFAFREAQLTSQEFSAIFGNLGMSWGISQATFGGPMELTGAGALGSIEPRAFDLLRAGQYGALGTEIAEDLARRAAITDPRSVATYDALTRTLQSVAGKISPEANARIWNLAERGYGGAGFQSWIEEGGGWLKAGRRNIFVPGGDILKPYMTAGGGVVRGDISTVYHTLARQLSATKSADLLDADAAIRDFIGGITKQQAPYGKGVGAIYRGKILGSRFLTGLTKIGGYAPTKPWTVGVPEKYGLQMFEELAERGIDIGTMRERFRAGKVVGGVLARHPFIGPYSLQPVGMQIMRGVTEPVISLPTFATSIRLAGEEAASPINLSPMVGLASDVDADIYSVSLVRPDIEKNLRKQFLYQDNELTRAYMEHSVRSQIITARTAKSTLPEGAITLKMIADAQKLGTTQEWVPLLSTELTAARRAVSERIADPRRQASAQFLLQLTEQVPISGKWLDPKRVAAGEMPTIFKTIQESLRARSAVRLEGVYQNILADNELARRLLTEDVKITEGLRDIWRITGVKMRDVLPAVDITRATEDIMSALEVSGASGMENMARMAAGRQAPTTVEQLGQHLAYTGLLLAVL